MKIASNVKCTDCEKPREEYNPFPICSLSEPLMMVIPPGGIHLDCPRHPQGHHIYGPQVTC